MPIVPYKTNISLLFKIPVDVVQLGQKSFSHFVKQVIQPQLQPRVYSPGKKLTSCFVKYVKQFYHGSHFAMEAFRDLVFFRKGRRHILVFSCRDVQFLEQESSCCRAQRPSSEMTDIPLRGMKSYHNLISFGVRISIVKPKA